jgi:hypothetical protein
MISGRWAARARTVLTAFVRLVLAPGRLLLFLADCLLPPRPWDAGAWTPRKHAH